MSISKYHVSKNLFDLASWITANGSTYTKDGESYTFASKQSMFTTVFYFSETNIDVSISGILTSGTITNPRIDLIKANGTAALSNALTESTSKSENVNCAGLRLNWSSTGGTLTITNLMLNTGSTALPYEPYGNTFKNWFYRKRETATDTITTFPKEIIGDGQSASAVIKGNMSQSGTPTPIYQIIPNECGDKTANLFPDTPSTANASLVQTTGEEIANNEFDIYTIPVTGETKYTVAFSPGAGAGGRMTSVHQYNGNTWISALVITSNASFPQTVTTDANATKIKISIIKNTSNRRCNVGETALPYQPNGYKLDIKSGNTTTPVYLGQVQSTRQIKKLVLTGEEGFSNQYGESLFTLEIRQDYAKYGVLSALCNAYVYNPVQSGLNANTNNGEFALQLQGGLSLLAFKNTAYTTPTDFKTYLQQQYSAGTPVTVWYVLATPTTGIVNEPIRKIGNYADNVSVTGIPTTGTAEQFDVDTTLKPSEVDLTYHGWHEHSDTEF